MRVYCQGVSLHNNCIEDDNSNDAIALEMYSSVLKDGATVQITGTPGAPQAIRRLWREVEKQLGESNTSKYK